MTDREPSLTRETLTPRTLTRRRLPRRAWPLLALLAAVVVLVPLLVATVRLPLGDTLILPGLDTDGVHVVSGGPVELSLAADVRNVGLVPVRVRGAVAESLGPYAVRLGRGGPGGGVPEEPEFAAFTLWPGQQRLVVAHLTRAGDAQDVLIDRFRLETSVLGVSRRLTVRLPTALQVNTG